jgi:CDP-glycerol glycerophosphotransferase (TagB/SpsB family)
MQIAIRLKEGDRPSLSKDIVTSSSVCDCRSGIESLKKHDIVLTDSSTMAFEAALLQKSVLMVGSGSVFVKLLFFPSFRAHLGLRKLSRVGFVVGQFRRLVAKICLGAWEGALARCVETVNAAADDSFAARKAG